MIAKKPNVVVIGGGTGTFTVLKGLREHRQLDLTAIITMADDGGSNKVLRDQFGLLPTSGIRQCIAAMSEDESILRELFSYRYHQGTGISGMTFGNLFMAALADITGSQKKAIEETCQLLHVRGSIYPVSYENTSLVATYQDGTEILGEHYIDITSPKVGKQRIVNLRTIPQITLGKDAKSAIAHADLIVLGPGDLYTNTVANLIVKGMRRALEDSPAKLVFVMNLMTKIGETYNYQATDFLQDLSQYLDPARFDAILLNSKVTLSPSSIASYKKEYSVPVIDDLGHAWQQAKLVRTPLMADKLADTQQGDRLARSLVRHDPTLLSQAILELID